MLRPAFVPPPKRIPSPYHPMHGVRLKLNRAQAYAEALKGKVDAWEGHQPYEIFGEYEPGPPEKYVFRVRMFEPPPLEWGLLLGDFAHNAHSALDLLAYQVVSLGNGGLHKDQTAFPIVLLPCKWQEAADFRLPGAKERHLKMIESFQPYNRTDAHGWHTHLGTLEDPLAILHRLSNVDKHIVFNATPAVVKAFGWEVDVVRDVASVGRQESPMGFLIDDKVMLEIDIVSCGPNPELELNRELTTEIRVQHRVTIGKRYVTLIDIPLKESVDEILARLREIFKVFVNDFR